MFGYVKPQKSELLVREFEEYGGIYCTLCRRLGKDYGIAARLALNYDCTFYALVLLAASKGDSPDFSKGRCVVNPLKKCFFCGRYDHIFSSAAALTVFLTYYKVKDDIADSAFWKSLLFRAISPVAAHARRRAAKRFPGFDRTISCAMAAQRQLESLENPGIDCCAEPTASMLADIFELSADFPVQASKTRILHQFGYYLGRWIYLMDAADDLEKDIRSNSFNPFVNKFKLSASGSMETLDAARSYANQVLNGTLAQLNTAVNLLDFNQMGPIVHNIVSLGLPQMQKERLFKKENGNVRSL